MKSETCNVTVWCRVRIRMTTNKSVERSNAPQETVTGCGYVRLQAVMSTVELFANKYIALNYQWNITGNYAVRMHNTLKHQCVHYMITTLRLIELFNLLHCIAFYLQHTSIWERHNTEVISGLIFIPNWLQMCNDSCPHNREKNWKIKIYWIKVLFGVACSINQKQ